MEFGTPRGPPKKDEVILLNIVFCERVETLSSRGCMLEREDPTSSKDRNLTEENQDHPFER